MKPYLPDYCNRGFLWRRLEEQGVTEFGTIQKEIQRMYLEANKELITKRSTQFQANCSNKPQEGEWLILADGSHTRFTESWDLGIQVGGERGSFYLSDSGCCYSGGLDPSIPYSKLELTAETKDGFVWIFDRDNHCAGNGFYFQIPFRVWRLKESNN